MFQFERSALKSMPHTVVLKVDPVLSMERAVNRYKLSMRRIFVSTEQPTSIVPEPNICPVRLFSFFVNPTKTSHKAKQGRDE